MSVANGANYALKMFEYMRAGARVNSRVPVRLRWQEAGAEHNVDAFTMDISPKGCLVIAPQGFAVGQNLPVKNGSNQKEPEAVLVLEGPPGPDWPGIGCGVSGSSQRLLGRRAPIPGSQFATLACPQHSHSHHIAGRGRPKISTGGY